MMDWRESLRKALEEYGREDENRQLIQRVDA